jgi:mannosyl-oligosaccharide glucosidase
LKDSLNNVKVTTELLKADGGENGGSWAARIKGEPINEGSDISASMSNFYLLLRLYRTTIAHFFYLLCRVRRDGGTRLGNRGRRECAQPLFLLALTTERSHQGIEGPIVLTGSTLELDDFTIRVVDGAPPLLTTVTHLQFSL